MPRLRARRRGRAALARRPRPAGRRRRRHPRRVLLRRLPAGRRDRALLAGHAGGRGVRRARAARCSASATASRCSARRGCCPARCCPTARCASSAARWASRSSTRDTAFTGACAQGDVLSIPVKHTTGRYFAPEPPRVVFRYAGGANPNGSQDDIAGVANDAGNVVGLMPHPEHAVDLLHGSEDGLRLFASAAEGRACRFETVPGVEQAVALGPDARRVRARLRQARPRAQRGRAGDVLAAVERALRLQALQEAPAHAAHRGPARRHGPGRERRGRRRRRRLGGGLQGRVPQPPQRGRAVPGRGHRRRRDPARHLRDRRAADRRARLAALRRADLGALALPARPRGRRHRPLRQLASACRPSAARSTSRRPYETNCLVNAMALGLARRDDMVRSAAAGVGNLVILFGASTGRDGIGGASVLASAELDDEDESKRPSVQVGDPFEESKLIECSLELLDQGLLVSLQDLGAAGLTSSASEMASAGAVGIDLDVSRVPLREADMAPFEIMVSESQERMLCVVEPDAGRRGAGRLREVGGPRHGHRRGHRHAPHADPARRRGRRRHPGGRAGRRLPALRPRPRGAGDAALPGARRDARARHAGPRDPAGAARLAQHRLAPPAVRAVRLPRRRAHRRGARSSPTPRCWRCPTATGSAWRSTATAGASPPTRTAARSSTSWSARRTSPASAPSRSA